MSAVVDRVARELEQRKWREDDVTAVQLALIEALADHIVRPDFVYQHRWRVGDVVVAWNGHKLEDANELPRLVAATKPGAAATMEVIREGKPVKLQITVGEIPSEETAAAASKPEAKEKATPANKLGLAVRELPAAELKTLGVDYAVVVVDVVGPPARSSPILPGDIILAVNQQRFSSIEEFNKLIAAQKEGSSVALLVRRGDGSLYVPMPVG